MSDSPHKHDAIKRAFELTRSGYSSDRVIADPVLRSAFLSECGTSELNLSETVLCRTLMNLRKAGKLPNLKSKPTRFKDDEYRFASEIAVRHLERGEQATLDDILCNPTLLKEFDSVCESLAPGFEILRYRWAALSLRKSRSVRPEILGHALPPKCVEIYACNDLSIDDIPTEPGIYIFLCSTCTLYVGEASNLRLRLKKHLDHSDNKQLARYIWEQGMENVRLEVQTHPAEYSTKVRKAIERELIRSREPLFNIAGVERNSN